MTLHKELKKEIFNWLLENENMWQRANACIKHFKNYIYDSNGEYLIGGKNISEFITASDKLIYKN